MARKNRLKRERSIADLASAAAEIRGAAEPEEPAVLPRANRQAVGARVARVSVDDETWAAFRELCGPTPASIRLGELVEAEVERSRNPAAGPDVTAAVRAIRSHVDELEALVRRIPPPA